MTRIPSTKRHVAALASLMLVTSALALGACSERSGDDGTNASTPSPSTKPAAPAGSAAGASGAPAVAISAGAKLYATHCAMCHGPTGQGDGAVGGSLNPPPRALAGEPWRYVKADTPEGEKAGIVNLLIEGVPGSAMPKYGSMLSQEDMMALADYVLSIRK